MLGPYNLGFCGGFRLYQYNWTTALVQQISFDGHGICTQGVYTSLWSWLHAHRRSPAVAALSLSWLFGLLGLVSARWREVAVPLRQLQVGWDPTCSSKNKGLQTNNWPKQWNFWRHKVNRTCSFGMISDIRIAHTMSLIGPGCTVTVNQQIVISFRRRIQVNPSWSS